MNYNAVTSNFYGKYAKNSIILDERDYDKKKMEHLQAQQEEIDPIKKKLKKIDRGDVGIYNARARGFTYEEIASMFNCSVDTAKARVVFYYDNVGKYAQNKVTLPQKYARGTAKMPTAPKDMVEEVKKEKEAKKELYK